MEFQKNLTRANGRIEIGKMWNQNQPLNSGGLRLAKMWNQNQPLDSGPMTDKVRYF